MRKILVTGAGGYLGSTLCTELVQKGFEVTGIDNFFFKKDTLKHLYDKKNFDFHNFDVREDKLYTEFVPKNDLIIPLAGIVGAPMCDKHHELAFEVNEQQIKKISVKIQGNGKETRAFCYIKDAIDAIIILSKKGKDNEIYNIGNDKEHSITKLIKAIEKIIDIKITVISGKLEKGSTLRRCPNINKIRKLGYRPKWKLEKGLLYTSENYIKN